LEPPSLPQASLITYENAEDKRFVACLK
jgi:hypothetical protein